MRTKEYGWWLGLLLAAGIAALAWLLARQAWIERLGFSMLPLAIVLGMLLGNTLYPHWEGVTASGILFAKNRLLRLGIILYGFRLTLQQVLEVGLNSIVADALMLTGTFLLACFLGLRWLKMDRDTVMLMGAGAGICGAAAVIATAPVLRADGDRVAVAVATVVIFGTVGIFLYPQIYAWQWWPLTDSAFGVYIGASVHEVAQVVAAGKAINAEVADIAVTTKMIRVMMLAPFLLLLSWWLARRGAAEGEAKTLVIPWFAVAFVAVMLFNSLHLLPQGLVAALIEIDGWLLAMAMAALGLTTRFAALRQAGSKPLLLGALLMVWLVAGGGLLETALSKIL
ncbi:MAG: YeiH family putative sulfate export transporter [Cardiobacteriaceae bacterium]|nr:YeiH family putative sulfate export transporter [Cardiobacteriaceae bacterium]